MKIYLEQYKQLYNESYKNNDKINLINTKIRQCFDKINSKVLEIDLKAIMNIENLLGIIYFINDSKEFIDETVLKMLEISTPCSKEREIIIKNVEKTCKRGDNLGVGSEESTR